MKIINLERKWQNENGENSYRKKKKSAAKEKIFPAAAMKRK